VLIGPAASHPPCEATILLQVDKADRRWAVRLPNGISPGATRVEIAEKTA